jgi:hypothetical protein
MSCFQALATVSGSLAVWHIDHFCCSVQSVTYWEQIPLMRYLLVTYWALPTLRVSGAVTQAMHAHPIR